MTTSSRTLEAGERLVRRVRRAVDPMTTHRSSSGGAGWLAVTILRDPDEIDLQALPAPLAELEDRIEVRVEAAPGDKGAELRARVRGASEGSASARLRGVDDLAALRSALREAKQILEVGEVLRVDPAPHGERPATPAGLLLEAWTRAAPGGGVR